jgi:diguanylate cyclase (GGDEF)-like protein
MKRPFFRFTIAAKMLTGYLVLSVIIIIIADLASSSIKQLIDINNNVIAVDAPIVEIASKMDDVIFAEELYGRSYLLRQRSPALLDRYHKEVEAFGECIRQLRSVPDRKFFSIKRLELLHEEYNAVFQKMFEYKGSINLSVSREFDMSIRARRTALTRYIKNMSSHAIWSQNRKRNISAEIGTSAHWKIIIYSIVLIVLALLITIMITGNIAKSIKKLKNATKLIAKGEFENLPGVKSNDELAELSTSLSEMARRLKKLELILIDMSPLTRLPGNLVIENTLKKRLGGGSLFAFCHFDIDNFKAFGDKYGYAMGSEVIKATAQIIGSSVAAYGAQDDLVGHIGGDDFVVVTTPDRYEKICCAVIETFDRVVPDFYSPEDRGQGFIMGKTRQGEEMAFPIMTISIGVVTNRCGKLIDPLQIGVLSAELKECAKSRPGSNYVVDSVEGDNLEDSHNVLNIGTKAILQN